MGNFYTSIALRSVTQQLVVRAMQRMRRRAFVSPTVQGITVVYDAKCEEQDTKFLSDLALRLSRELQCAAWGVLNHDDDVLWYVLCSNGEYADSYNSAPDYFDEDQDGDPTIPEGGDAKALASLLNSGKGVRKVDVILRRSDANDGAYVFALDRHRELAETLGIPFSLVSIGYENIARGELPDDLQIESFAKVGK
ncbi:MAG: hypothetical protein ACM359_06820 [Bacillota bacterium]